MCKSNKKHEDKIEQELSADGSNAGVEKEPEFIDLEPFDPEKISIDPKPVVMETFLRRLLQGTIRLAPAFQRKAIWDIGRKSRLIESLMLKIPLPIFYVAADEKASWDVVDGLQRLTALKEFILGDDYIQTRKEELRGKGFQLKELEFWKQFEGNHFNELPELLANRILETEFQFIIINPGTPEEVKRNIFKRINTGGMPLSAQEIRHALYQGEATKLLAKLVESPIYIKATGGSIDDSRMAGRELILRFFAFSLFSYKEYPKTSNMDTFLCDAMGVINIMPDYSELKLKKVFKDRPIPVIRIKNITKLQVRFEIAMQRALTLFDEHTFRKSYDKKRPSPVNKTLFEVWGNLLADLKEDKFEILIKNKQNFLSDYQLLLNETNFYALFSRLSSKYLSVKERYKILETVIKRYTQ